MKKILFLLLCTVSIYGQTSTGQEQEFDYGIKNNSLQTITTPTYIGTFGTDGTQGKIPSAYIAKTAAVQDSLNKKINLPTGFLQGLQLSINADPTKFNIAAGYYVVTDFTNLTQPVVKIINYAGATGLTPAYLATSNSTYIALDINGAVVSSASPFTDAQRRTLVIVGNVVHSNNTTINVTNEIKAPIVAVGNQLHDFMKAIGFLNESGNVYSANGANLQINKSVGDIFGMGINASDYLSPHKLTIPSQTALTFAYRFQNGTQLSDTQNINPNIYDVGGTSTATPSNKWTIQRINLFQSGLSRIQPGQTVYNSFNDAVVALPTQPFVTEQNIADNAVFRCYLIVQQGTTNLASAVAGGSAQFVPVDKFGNIIGNGSVALTYSNIVAALGFTPENVANKSDSYTVSSSTTYASTKALVDGLATKQNTLTNPITGTGTTNYLPKFTASGTVGNSNLVDNGTNITSSLPIISPSFSFQGTNITEPANESSFAQIKLQPISGNKDLVFQFAPSGTSTTSVMEFYSSSSLTLTSRVTFKNTNNVFKLGGDAANVPLTFVFSNTEKARFAPSGNLLLATTTDDGTNKLQVNGTISATGGTTANQVVVKSQLDGKVSLTGNETVAGNKTLSGTTTLNETIIREGYQLKFPKGVMYQSSVGTNALTDNRTVSFPDASGTIALVETVKPYKVYTALLSQTGTSAPTATVLENTLGGTVVWTRSTIGQYVGTLTGAFTDQKTIIFVNRSNPSATAFDTNMAANVININTVGYTTFSNSAYVDGQTNSASIEIRVYN